jgi:DNA-binding IclR family transcriptional regulator
LERQAKSVRVTELEDDHSDMSASSKSPRDVAQKPRKSIQSVETGVRVLEALISCPGGCAPLRDIAAGAEMSRSQAHRYLQAYINTGLVQQEPADGRYSLGPTALKIGLSALSRLDVIRITTAYLRQLADDLETTGLLSIWGDYGPTIIRWLDGGVPIATSLHVGSVLPIQHSSAGLVFMAFQPLPAYKRLLERERAARTSIDEIELQAMLTEIRRQGYAKVDGQVVPGLAAISVPVFDMQEKLIAVIGVLGRMTDEKFFCQSNIDKVQAAALKASNAMGWQPEEMRGDS